MSTDMQDACEVLVIRTGNLLVCADLRHIERTFSLVAMQEVPGSAPYVAGIVNYAGNSLVVIDLAIRLGLRSAPYSLDTPLMVCTHGQRRVGVIVQDIVGIKTLRQSDRQLARELGGPGAAFLASAHIGQELALLLDIAWVVNSELYQAHGGTGI